MNKIRSFLPIFAQLTFLSLMGGLEGQLCLDLSIDYLYWRPCTDSFFVVLDVEGVSDSVNLIYPPTTSTDPLLMQVPFTLLTEFKTNAKMVYSPDHPSSGFRLNATIPLCCELNLNWLHFTAEAKKHLVADCNRLIPFSLQGHFNEPTSALIVGNEIRSKWELEWDQVDLTFGTRLNFSQCFQITPKFGLRYSNLYQELNMYSMETTVSLFNGTAGLLMEGDEVHRLKTNGLGPFVGLEFEYYLGCGLSLSTQCGGAVVYSQNHANNKQDVFRKQASNNFPVVYQIAKGKSNRTCSMPILDFGIFLGYERCICEGYILFLELGWESHTHFNQNVAEADNSKLYLAYNNHDLSFQGITAKFGVGF